MCSHLPLHQHIVRASTLTPSLCLPPAHPVSSPLCCARVSLAEGSVAWTASWFLSPPSYRVLGCLPVTPAVPGFSPPGFFWISLSPVPGCLSRRPTFLPRAPRAPASARFCSHQGSWSPTHLLAPVFSLLPLASPIPSLFILRTTQLRLHAPGLATVCGHFVV